MAEAQSCSLTVDSNAVNAGCRTTQEAHEVYSDLSSVMVGNKYMQKLANYLISMHLNHNN